MRVIESRMCAIEPLIKAAHSASRLSLRPITVACAGDPKAALNLAIFSTNGCWDAPMATPKKSKALCTARFTTSSGISSKRKPKISSAKVRVASQ